MSGQWNTRPRKGERSVEGQRSDREHAIRLEYRDSGAVVALADAWAECMMVARVHRGTSLGESIETGANACATAIGVRLISDFPKRGAAELIARGCGDVEAYRRIAESKRRAMRDAVAASKKIGGDLDGA